MTNKKRYAIVMAISIVLNLVFSEVVGTLNLPFWLDIQGTALAALVLEPTAGLIVGLINNFFLAVFMLHDSSSLIYFAASAAVALIVGIHMRTNGKIDKTKILSTAVLVIITTSVISALITMWRSGGLPDAYWESFYYHKAISAGFPRFISCLYGTVLVKIYDTAASCIIVFITYCLLPSQLKYPPKEKGKKV